MTGRFSPGAILLAVAWLVAGAGCVLVAWFVAWWVFLESCDAEFGVDSSSPAGRLCSSPVGTGWFALAAIGPPVLALAFAWTALRRRSLRRPLVALAAVAVTLTAVGVVMLSLRSACTDAEYRAAERWEDDGSRGEPPAVCDSY